MTKQKTRRVTETEWRQEGEELFGTADPLQWEFVCPVCGCITKGEEWSKSGALDAVAFSCIGRWREKQRKAFDMESQGFTKGGPCDYAGGGLFRLNPVLIILENGHERETFEFAKRDK